MSRDGFYGIDQSATLHKGRNTPYMPGDELNAFPACLKEGRKSVPTLLAGRERIRNAFCPVFFL